MIDIALQIQKIIDKRFNHNKAAFARAVGISPTTLASYLNPKKASKPTSDFLCDVVEKLGINAAWLLTGQGEMEEKQKPQGDDVDTHGANSPGKIVGNVSYDQRQQLKELVEEEKVEDVIENHCPEDLHKIEVLTVKVDSLTSENRKQEATIADLRDRVEELKERIKELKGKK
ncbi:hypothetical protein [Xylanibacter muris]|uniref:hypothetical protein n=1 Tax=Xylanibacter muris TaxID=2736290 RepID=UPI0025A01DBD|nr:hypothetical protein [Xylanibacter muris]